MVSFVSPILATGRELQEKIGKQYEKRKTKCIERFVLVLDTEHWRAGFCPEKVCYTVRTLKMPLGLHIVSLSIS